jgi:hypothetical protein
VGTITGATWTKGKTNFGNALSFNGAGAFVTINDSASLDLTIGMTLEAWVYPTALPAGWSDIIYKDQDIYFLMGSTAQGRPDMGGSFASANIYGRNPLPLNKWTHLAATYDGAFMKFYVDSVEATTDAQPNGQPQTGSIQTSTGALSIGGDARYGQYWTGMIDEVRVYNRALTQSEIQKDRNTPLSTLAPRAPTNAPPRVAGN